VTTPSGPTAATSTPTPMPTTVADVAWLAAAITFPHHHAAAEYAMAHAVPVMPIGMLWYLSSLVPINVLTKKRAGLQ